RQSIKNIAPAHAKLAAALAAASSPEYVGENVLVQKIGKAVRRRVRMLLRTGAVEIAVVALARPFGAGGIDFAALETRALFRISQDIIGARYLLEFLLGLLVAGV